MLTIKEVMAYSSFKHAKLITGETALDNPVNGIMVMEAPDIEVWGREGLIILTSYFAMKDSSTERIIEFLDHAKKIGISAIVVKIDRLVYEIPDIFVSNCRDKQIPLFQIDKVTPYEKIISEVLENIINRNAFVLQRFYDIHKQFTQLMMSQPEIIEILNTLKELINRPVSFFEMSRDYIFGTDPDYDRFTIVHSEKNKKDERFNFDFMRNKVVYQNEADCIYDQLVFPVPNLSYEKYQLIIHEGEQEVTDLDFMAIENAITALQTDLLTRYAIRQSKQSRLNEMASDLVHGRLNKQEDIDDTITQLGLDPTKNYRIILIGFHAKKNIPQTKRIEIAPYVDALINQSRVTFPDRIYITRKNTLIVIAPDLDEKTTEIKNRIAETLAQPDIKSMSTYFSIHTTISNIVSLANLADGYRQAVDAQKILQLTKSEQAVFSYQDMGIYQIFVETDNLNSLKRFVPDSFLELQKENPELLTTLHTFIDSNQNYTETAQKLFVHPKTVRYRIDRLKEIYRLDLDNAEEILRYAIGFRLLKFIGEINDDSIL